MAHLGQVTQAMRRILNAGQPMAAEKKLPALRPNWD